MLMRLIFGLLLSLFVFAAPAVADVFQVRGLRVDETGLSGQEARDKALAQARYRGAQALLDRLTLPEDRNAATTPVQVSDIARFGGTIDRMAQDKVTATRFIGVFAITYDAKSVRDYLDAHGVPFVESQAGRAILVPLAGGALDPVSWAEAWRSGANDTLLTPYVVSGQVFSQRPQWADLAPEAATLGAARALVAEGYPAAGGIVVRLSELRPGQPDTVLGALGPFADPAAAQAGSIRDLETKWKQATVVRTSGVTAMTAVAGFRDLGDWVRIWKGLEGSRIIRDIRVESLSALGADVSFLHAGRPDQLAADLRSRGILLNGSDAGWTLEAIPVQ